VDEVARAIEAARQTLFRIREARVKPSRDDKVLAGWNGLAIRGLAFAARVFGREDWARLAQGAADFVLEKLWDGERLLRVWGDGTAKIDGFLEDYGDLAAGLTTLYQATFEPKYLTAAAKLEAVARERFWDEKSAAYLSAPRGQKDLLCETFALHDNAYPSGASTLTEAQLSLAAITGDEALLRQTETYLSRLKGPMRKNPFAFGHLLLAADTFLDGAAELTLAVPRAGLARWKEALASIWAPTLTLAHLEPGQPVPVELANSAVAEAAREEAAYLCRHFACELPLTDPKGLRSRLDAQSRQ
jgi:uncharacterized protein YyaL (SSP411 family)